jgi:hypothetical protein
MTFRVHLIRLLAATLFGVTACVFASLYNWASELTIERGSTLPAVTLCVVKYSPYAYAVPALVLVVGIVILRGRRDPSLPVEILSALGCIAAFAWVLLTILSWQVARIQIINHGRV